MYRLVRDGHVDGSRYVQIGLRGYWPGEKEFALAGRARDHELLHARRPRPRDPGRRGRHRRDRGGGPVFLSVDIDVLDPAFAPGTGTPEPGGMTTADLLWACREIASRTRIVGMDVVEVLPTGAASADITALAADRIVREAITGIAVGRQ